MKNPAGFQGRTSSHVSPATRRWVAAAGSSRASRFAGDINGETHPHPCPPLEGEGLQQLADGWGAAARGRAGCSSSLTGLKQLVQSLIKPVRKRRVSNQAPRERRPRSRGKGRRPEPQAPTTLNARRAGRARAGWGCSGSEHATSQPAAVCISSRKKRAGHGGKWRQRRIATPLSPLSCRACAMVESADKPGPVSLAGRQSFL